MYLEERKYSQGGPTIEKPVSAVFLSSLAGTLCWVRDFLEIRQTFKVQVPSEEVLHPQKPSSKNARGCLGSRWLFLRNIHLLCLARPRRSLWLPRRLQPPAGGWLSLVSGGSKPSASSYYCSW